jgi:multicomponent Na+:H+ antiporter subunit F
VADFFFIAAAIIVAITAVGLLRVLRGPRDADRMMATQLLGTGGVAALLLAEVRGTRGAVDVALVLALLAAISGVAFVNTRLVGRCGDVTSDMSKDDHRD